MSTSFTIRKILRAAVPAVLLFVLSCEKEVDSYSPAQGDGSSLRVSLPDSGTRTFLGAEAGGRRSVLWSAGDRISVGKAVSGPLGSKEAGGSSAIFSFSTPLEAPFNVLYPASETGTVELPSSQQFIDGSCDPAALPMYGSGWNPSELRLSHFSSVLQVQLTGAGKSVSRIMVLSSDGKPLSGSLIPETGDGGLFNGKFALGGASSVVSLECPAGGTALGSSPKSFFIAVPAGEYPLGFQFVVQAVGGGAMRLAYTPQEGRLDAARLVRFPSRQFAEDSGFTIISTEEELLAFAADPSAETALIVADLDMSGREWTPFSLSNVLDGGGHTVKGLSGPMFTTVSGTLRNIVLDSAFSVDPGENSGLVATQITGTVENVVLNGRYTYSPSAEISATSYFGGIAARLTGGGAARNCRVGAEILVPSSVSVAADIHIGGLFGQASSSTVEGCCFEGRMDIAPRSPGSYVSKGFNLGGIAGSLSGGRSASNIQRGLISFTGSWLNTLRYGGVFGYVSGSAACENDRNDGRVSAAPVNTDTDKARYGGVGGVYGIIDNANIIIKGAVNGPDAVVSYLPESSPSFSFCIGGVIQSVYKDAADISGLVSSGRIVVDGSENATTASRRGIFAGGVLGTGVSTHVHDCLFDGEMEIVPLSSVRNAVGGIIGQLGDNDPSASSTGAVASCTVASGAKIILQRKYTDKPVMAGGIAGMSRSCDGSISSCTFAGSISSTGTLAASSERQFFGAIAGQAYSGSTHSFSLSGCIASGSISLLKAVGSERICAGGILGGASVGAVSINNCQSSTAIQIEGNVVSPRLGGVAGLFYSHSGGMTANVESCRFTGELSLLEDKKVSDAPIAGGIVGYAGAASSAEMVNLRIAGCSSSGNIRRKLSGVSSVIPSNRSVISVAGGILGSAGLRQIWETEDVSGGEKTCSISVEVVSDGFVQAEIADCVHSGLIFFNPNAGDEDPLSGAGTRIELSPNFSVGGGIAGVSAPSGGSLRISGCKNSGSLFSTSGMLGGLVGWIHTMTQVTGSDNSGLVYERDINIPVGTGSGTGYVVGGGLIGGVDKNAEGTVVEYCWNSGNVAGSSLSAMPLPCAGGLVGSYGGGSIFRHCKNSGHVRNYPGSGSADLGGYFSGDKASGSFTSCAAGGWVARAGKWAAADASWASRAFGESNPGSNLQNCTMWDNHSKLPWED